MNTRQSTGYQRFKKEMSWLFSLKEDKADDELIDSSLRNGVDMRGTNLWVLMFAIFIASIGLNVNSTAVIIGAMLISPLMGPIMGIGYGVGIYDFQLIRASLKSLGIAALIGLLTSTVYFLITPLNVLQSELLARTTPTIWDVLIALFGGLSGIVGATRKEKSNVIPGVAIATALMPPLCTAGYGIANGNWAYFGGAFYLFTINCVFIALTSALVIRAFRVKTKHFVDAKIARKVKEYAFLVAILTVVPSIYLAYQLVNEEVFKSKATLFIQNEVSSEKTYVTESVIDTKKKLINVTVIGEYLDTKKLAELSAKLVVAGIPDAKIKVHQQDDQEKIDVTTLKTGLLSDLYSQSQIANEKQSLQIKELENKIKEQQDLSEEIKRIPKELNALYPQITEIWLSEAVNWEEKSGLREKNVLVVNVKLSKDISSAEFSTLERWLNQRFETTNTKLVVEKSQTSNSSKRK